MAKTNRDDIDKLMEYNIYLPTRTIYMGSESTDDSSESGTDYKMAERMIKCLHILDNSAPAGDNPITIIMNNPGGDEYHGMAIYDAIKSCKNHITIIAMGHAMSMGSIILQAADKRIMSPNSKFMIHYGTPIHVDSESHPKVNDNWIEEDKKFRVWMEDLYLGKILEKHPKFNKKKLIEMLNFDTILSAQETIDLGLADEILY